MSAATGTSVVVFTRDLRVRDHPALVEAARADAVVPLFVFDDAVVRAHGSANRTAFMLDCVDALRSRLRELGAELVVRRGDWVEQVVAIVEDVGATDIHVSADVSAWARRRDERLAAELSARGARLHRHPGVTVVAPGATAPSGGGHWKVFSPFHRRWLEHPWRPVLGVPSTISMAAELDPGELPTLAELIDGEPSPGLRRGGESVALADLRAWASDHLEEYEVRHDDLAGDATSHIAAALHFGTLSPLEVATRLRDRPGGAAFVRQLCWRDFYHQLLAARPETSQADVRTRGDRWRDDPDDLRRWQAGLTGFPVVDAGMRQLREEGFMHNRARMIVASFLTKDLYLDWRHGAEHFMSLLADGDLANNQLNWQWTAGTGTDTNPNRIFNPTVQSRRFDPDGTYIRRYVEELADVDAAEVHDPTEATRRRVGYPMPMVDHHVAIAAYRAQLAAASAGG